MPQNEYLIGYADDIEAVIIARGVVVAQKILNQVMRKVIIRMDEHGLSLSTEKTEIVLLIR